MTRNLFPNDRFAFEYSGPGRPLLQATESPIEIYNRNSNYESYRVGVDWLG